MIRFTKEMILKHARKHRCALRGQSFAPHSLHKDVIVVMVDEDNDEILEVYRTVLSHSEHLEFHFGYYGVQIQAQNNISASDMADYIANELNMTADYIHMYNDNMSAIEAKADTYSICNM
jgi:hypothetical protein